MRSVVEHHKAGRVDLVLPYEVLKSEPLHSVGLLARTLGVVLVPGEASRLLERVNARFDLVSSKNSTSLARREIKRDYDINPSHIFEHRKEFDNATTNSQIVAMGKDIETWCGQQTLRRPGGKRKQARIM